MKKKPTIVLLSASTGYGHTKAALSLKQAFEDKLPNWDIVHRDTSKDSYLPRQISVEQLWAFFSMSRLTKPIYSVVHRFLVSNALMANVARRAFRGTGNRLHRQFSGHDVQVVIALHPGAAAAASLWKRKQRFLLASIATDLVVHEFQAFKEIDQVYCDRRAMVLIAPRNLSSFSERARFSGLPVEEKFFQRQIIERSKNCTNVLFSFGAMGLGSTKQLHRFISAIAKDPKLVATIVCGHNSKMRQIANNLICKFGIQCRADVLGFVDNMDELLRTADILVGKPGGLTSGELMASGKHAVILELLPGQEEYNLQVLQRFGMASFAPHGSLANVLANVSKDSSVQNITFLQDPRKRGVNAIIDGICETIETEHCRKQSALATVK